MLLKLEKWWVYKIAGGLLTVILVTYLQDLEVTEEYWRKMIALFGVFVLLAIYGHTVNDVSDRVQDKLVHKPNLANKYGAVTAAILVAVTSLLAIALVVTLASPVVLGFTVLQIFLNALYSLKPCRLKERGLLAVLVTGFYERVIPYAMIFLVFGLGSGGLWLFFSTYLFWAYIWEVRNHLQGQLNDFEADRVSDVSTFVLVIGRSYTKRLIRLLFFGELTLLMIWLTKFELGFIVLGMALTLSWYFQFRKTGHWRLTFTQLVNLADDSYNHCFPVLFALGFSLTGKSELVPLALLLLLIFDNYVRKLVFVGFSRLKWAILGSDVLWYLRNWKRFL